jgi:hypothetical protein
MKKILYALGVLLLAVAAVFFMRSYWEKETIALIDQYIEQHQPGAGVTIHNSDLDYAGSSTTQAFIASEPYVLNIQGSLKTYSLGGVSRGHDFSGQVPFVSPVTNRPDSFGMQAWYSGLTELYGNYITNDGIPGRIDKTTFGNDVVTRIAYNANDGITQGKCRSQILSFPVPPRTHARWDLNVAFGKPDGVSDWTLTPTGSSPVLFWQLWSENQLNPPLAMNVDTDSNDPSKLMIIVMQRVGGAPSPVAIATIHGISRYTLTPIVIEAFLDERTIANSGTGSLKIWVQDNLILEQIGPQLATGSGTHIWVLASYLWNNPNPYPYTRATFWKTAKMLVYPSNPTLPTANDTTAPSSPLNLVASSPDASKVYLSWTASTDQVGVSGYRIYRGDTEIATSTITSLTDTDVIGGTNYNYKVQASDIAGNLSDASNIADVAVPPQAFIRPNISSFYVSDINTNAVNLNWSTNDQTTGVVYFGKTLNLGDSRTDWTLANKHSLFINGLESNTRYYYKIVSYTQDLKTSVETSIFDFTTQ